MISAPAALRRAGTRPEGLSDAEAASLLARHGRNVLPEAARPTLTAVILRQFRNPLIYLLLAAVAASVLLGKWDEALFILLVLAVDAGVGAFEEWKAEGSAAALHKTLRIQPTVLRDGRRRTIDLEGVVPGDIVLLESGGGVPADLRLLSAHGLRIDESLLTGESAAIDKDPGADCAADAAVGDRHNMAFAGTVVTTGRGAGVVCATAGGTQLGQIARALSARGAPPPLLLRMEALTRRIVFGALLLLPILAVVQLLQGALPADVLMLSVAITVAAAPEGLPVAVTAALAIASSRMARRNVIVRRLPAVEGLGSCTLIASDKTGTLTVNRLTVKTVALPNGSGFRIGGEGLVLTGSIGSRDGGADTDRDGLHALALAGALANEAHLDRTDGAVEASGDAVDIAFLVLAAKLGAYRPTLLQDHAQHSTMPYEPEQAFSASSHLKAEARSAYVKGAPETVLPMCTGIDRAAVDAQVHQLAARGYRVIALAAGPVAADGGALHRGHLEGLRFLGLAGLVDPLRPGAAEAVARCRAAGIDVRIVTGDHPETALALARRLDPSIRADQVVTGRELASLGGEALRLRIASAMVYARVEPTQKTQIVEALQKGGHFVAVTGDGVNDAPALKAAHVGVAMGAGGTDVARASADLIIGDDDFSSIVAGVEEGRAAYDNIRKIVWLLAGTAVTEIVLFALSLALGLPMPLTAVQILWVNLVTEGLQDVVLGFERKEPGVMSRPPRPPREPIFDRLMIEQSLVSGLYTGGLAFGLYWWMLGAGYDQTAARNLLVLFLVFFQAAQTLACRSETRSVLSIPLRDNPLFVAAVVGAPAIHVAATYLPGARDMLELAPVGPDEWLTLLVLAASVLGVTEIYKLLRARPLFRRLAMRPSAPDRLTSSSSPEPAG